jgi:hypothetical protein
LDKSSTSPLSTSPIDLRYGRSWSVRNTIGALVAPVL